MLNEEFYVRSLNKYFMSWSDVPKSTWVHAGAAFAVLFLVIMAMYMFRIDDAKNKESCCDLISEKQRMIKHAIWFPIVGIVSIIAYVIYVAYGDNGNSKTKTDENGGYQPIPATDELGNQQR